MHGIADHIDGFVADLKRRNFRPNTVRAYTADLRTIAYHLTIPLDQITRTAVEVVFDALAAAPATAARRGASLNRFFIWAIAVYQQSAGRLGSDAAGNAATATTST